MEEFMWFCDHKNFLKNENEMEIGLFRIGFKYKYLGRILNICEYVKIGSQELRGGTIDMKFPLKIGQFLVQFIGGFLLQKKNIFYIIL